MELLWCCVGVWWFGWCVCAQDGWMPLHVAAQKGHDKVVAQLVQAKANVDLADKDGATPLYVAALHGHRPPLQDLAGLLNLSACAPGAAKSQRLRTCRPKSQRL